MYTFYSIVLIILAALLSPVILVAFLVQPKFRAGFLKKLGFYPNSVILSEHGERKNLILFHTVSVGEVNALEALIKRTKQEFPDSKIAVTTVTKTGQEVANNKLKDTADIITYFPYDIKFCINSLLNTLNPQIIIIAETEIWPCFCHEVKKRNIPLLLVNGRISPTSYKGYKKAKFFFRHVLNNFSSILMQTQSDMDRIVDIGAPQEKTEVMGNLKFDITNKLNDEQVTELRNSLKTEGKRILIAGSTHKGEDEIIIETYRRLKQDFQELKLLIAPRHPERNEQVYRLLASTGLNIGKRSNNNIFKDSDIILLDTMGELGKLYSVADIAFLGGSFSGTGGHNPLEAAIYGIPVISGETVFNFKDIYRFMTDSPAAKLVKNKDELYEYIKELLSDTEVYEAASKACFEIFEKNRGALDYAIEKIKYYI